MRFLILSLIMMVNLCGYSQRAKPDILNTDKGLINIQPILHGTLVLEWNKEVIYVDPYGGPEAFNGIKDPTLILITDIHGDHLNLNTLESINTGSAKMIAPQAVADKLPDNYKSLLTVVSNNEQVHVNNIPIRALPMYNLPEVDDSKHPKGRGNGYILNLGGKLIYLAGDTEDIPEMRSLKDIDVAFVCMNLPYTMDIEQAADAVLAFKPTIVYPYHYRGAEGLSDIESFKKKVNAIDNQIKVRLRNWYPQ